MITLYSKDGLTAKAEIHKFTYTGTFMGTCFLSATISSPCPINFADGDYCVYRGETFILSYDPAKEKQAKRNTHGEAFIYDNIKFNSLADELTRIEFNDIVLHDNGISYTSLPNFSFYAKSVKDLADRIQANLDREYKGSNAWTVTVSPEFDSPQKNISVNGLKVSEALQLANSEFGANYIIRGRTITIGTEGISVGKVFGYGKGNGLYDIQQVTNQDAAIITRLKAYGSNRNLPYRYYNKLKDSNGNPYISEALYIPHLMLPEFPKVENNPSKIYIDSDNITKYGVREGSVYFDSEDNEIYPSIEGMTAQQLAEDGISVSLPAGDNGILNELLDAENPKDDGKLPEKDKDPIKGQFTIYLKDLGFDLSEKGSDGKYKYASTETMQISMKSGACVGRVFDVVENGITKDKSLGYTRFKVVCNRFTDSSINVAFPNSSNEIKTGDKFVILGIEMPDVYIRSASMRLLEAAKEYLSQNDSTKYTYTPKIDEIFMANNPEIGYSIKEGDIFNFADTDLDIDASVIIQTLKITEGESLIPSYEVSLSNDRISNSIEKMQNAINTLASNFTGVTIGQVKSLIQSVGSRYFLSRLVDDSASGNLNLTQNVSILKDLLVKKNIISEKSVISNQFGNDSFTSGQFGSGFRAWIESNGQSYAEIDNLLVRREMLVNVLSIAEIKSVGGQILLSLANMYCKTVTDKGSTWKCAFDNDNGKIPNQFALNDQVICRKFTGEKVKYYWALVTAVGDNYIEISKTDKDGLGIPSVEDEIIQFGNRTNPNRQSAIMLSAYGSDAPSIKQYAGVNSYDLTGKEVTVISPQGNKFTGSFTISTNGTSTPVYKDRGTFQNGKTYYLNDRVSYLGSYWVCIVESTITTPSETSVAWRKDTAGQIDIDNAVSNIQVGASNIVDNSSFKWGTAPWLRDSSHSISVDSKETFEGVNSLKCIATSGGNDVGTDTRFYYFRNKENGSYAFSFYAKSDVKRKFRVRVGSAISSNIKEFELTTEWQYYEFTRDNVIDTFVVWLKESGTMWFAKPMIVKGNKPTQWSPSTSDINKEIEEAKNIGYDAQASAENAQQDVSDLNNYVDGAFKDGVIDNAEAKAIEKYLNSINETMVQVEATYSKLFSNPYLEGVAKTNLSSTKTKLFIARDNLVTSINKAIADGIATQAEKQDVDAKFALFNSALKDFQNAVEDANKAIQDKLDSLGTEKINNLSLGVRNLLRDTAFDKLNTAYWQVRQNSHIISIDSSQILNDCNSLKIEAMQTPVSSSDDIWAVPTVALVKNGDYLVSFWAKGDTSLNVRTGFANNSSTLELSDTWKYYQVKINTGMTNPSSKHLLLSLTSAGVCWINNIILVEGNKSAQWQQAPEDAIDRANEAQQKAEQAQIDANEANKQIADIAADNKLTPTEKKDTKKEWDINISEYPKNVAQAKKFDVSPAAYTTAYNALAAYINPLLTNLDITSDINGTTFRNTFKAYYDARTDLLNAITVKSKALADAAQTAADKANKEAEKVRTEYKADVKLLDDKIASKVSQSVFDVLGNRVSQTESRIDQQAGRITSIVEKVNDIKIGGKNLVDNSQAIQEIGGNGADNHEDVRYTNLTVDLVKGEEYTFQCKTDGVWGTVNATDTVEAFLMKDKIVSPGNFVSMGTNPCTFTAPKTGRYWIRIDSNKGSVKHSFWEFQIEKGNKATDWGLSQNDINKSIKNVENKVDNMFIGSDNLITNSAFIDSVSPWLADGNHSISFDNDEKHFSTNSMKIVATSGGDTGGSTHRVYAQPVMSGQITISFYAKAASPIKMNMRIGVYNNEVSSNITTFDIGTSWELYTTKTIWTSSNAIVCWLESAGIMWMAKPMVVNGNTVPAWSQSSKDIELIANAAQSSANEAKNTASEKNRTYYQDDKPEIPSEGHKVGDLWYMESLVDSSGNVNPEKDKNIYQLQYRWDGTTWVRINWSISQSQYTQTEKEVQRIVYKTGVNQLGESETLYSKFDQTADQIRLEVSGIRVGGRNLLLNSSNYSDLWKQKKSGEVITNNYYNGSRIVELHDAWGGIGYIGKNINARQYMFSFYAKIDREDAKHEGYLICYGTTNAPIITAINNLTTEWKQYSAIITPNFADKNGIRIEPTVRINNNVVRICGFKLEEGNKATDYSPALEDTQAAIDSKTTLDEVASSLTIDANKISLASKTIELNGTTIAKAIAAKDLEVESPEGLSTLKVKKDGTFYAKGTRKETEGIKSVLTIDSDRSVIEFRKQLASQTNDNEVLGLFVMGNGSITGYEGVNGSKVERIRFTTDRMPSMNNLYKRDVLINERTDEELLILDQSFPFYKIEKTYYIALNSGDLLEDDSYFDFYSTSGEEAFCSLIILIKRGNKVIVNSYVDPQKGYQYTITESGMYTITYTYKVYGYFSTEREYIEGITRFNPGLGRRTTPAMSVVASNGLASVWDASKYFYISSDDNEYFIRAQGRIKLTTANSKQSIILDDTGIKFEGLTNKAKPGYLYVDSNKNIKMG